MAPPADTTVLLGHETDGTITTVRTPPGHSTLQAFTDITHPDGVWTAHSTQLGPAWVASSDPHLAAMLAAHYQCPVCDMESGA